MPGGGVTETSYVWVPFDTLVTVLVTVWDPANSPIAIFGWLRSEPSKDRPRPAKKVHEAWLNIESPPQAKAAYSKRPAS